MGAVERNNFYKKAIDKGRASLNKFPQLNRTTRVDQIYHFYLPCSDHDNYYRFPLTMRE